MLEVHTFERSSNGWRLLGGGSGPQADALVPRARVSEGATPGVSASGGGTARGSSTLFRGALNRWVWWAQLQLAHEVAALQVGGRRLVVAAHGMAVVVWAGERDPVVALDASGCAIGPVSIRESRWLPPEYRDG